MKRPQQLCVGGGKRRKVAKLNVTECVAASALMRERTLGSAELAQRHHQSSWVVLRILLHLKL